MSDEITSNPAPVNTRDSQATEIPISTPPEAVITTAPAEVPVDPVPVSEPTPEPSSGHLGGNDPIEPAPAESIPPTPTIETTAETPVAVTEPALTEITQSAPIETVIETMHGQAVAVEAPAPVQMQSTPDETQTPAVEIYNVAEAVPVQTMNEAEVEIARTDSVVPVAGVPVSAGAPAVSAPAQDPQSGQSVRIDPIEPEILPETKAVLRATDPAKPTAQPPESLNIQKSVNKFLAKGNPSIEVRKQKKLERIMGMFNERANITNDEVEKFLHISDSTATRYLATLEKEGKIKQGDKKGSAVSYSKI